MKLECETPKDTHMQSPTTVSVSSCYDVREIVLWVVWKSFLPMKSNEY